LATRRTIRPTPVTVQGPAVESDEMLVAGGPRGEELDEGGMQGDVAVIAQP
jgi:hypothetical protein